MKGMMDRSGIKEVHGEQKMINESVVLSRKRSAENAHLFGHLPFLDSSGEESSEFLESSDSALSNRSMEGNEADSSESSQSSDYQTDFSSLSNVFMERKGTISPNERYLQKDLDLYVIPWSGYPRAQAFLHRLISIQRRFPCNKKLERFGDFQGQGFSNLEVNDINKDLKVLAVGNLRDKIKIEVLVRNMKQLEGNYTLESNISYHLPVRDPVVIVITAKVASESDFKTIQQEYHRIVEDPDMFMNCRIIYAIDADAQISRQTIKSTLTEMFDLRSEECIVFDWKTTDELSKQISNSLEEFIISALENMEQTLKKNLSQELSLENQVLQVRNHFSRGVRRGVRKIKEVVDLLFIDNRLMADELLLGFMDKEGLIQTDALKDRLLYCQLQVVQRKTENVLSSLINIEQDAVTRHLDEMNFMQICRLNIKDATLDALIQCIPQGVMGYPCERLKNSNGRVQFLEMFANLTHDNHGKLLTEDLSNVIRDATKRCIILEMKKYCVIQEKLHFEVVSVLKRTIARERFEHLMPSIEFPSGDLFAIDGVKGYGIMYNKLHVHIEITDNEGDTKVRDKIKEMLIGYAHSYEISQIVSKPLPLFCIGQKLFTSCSVNGVESKYGSIGAFMKDQNDDLYLLTSKHVVAFAADPSALCLENNDFSCGDEYASIGADIYIPSCINMEASNQQVTNFIDLAAVKIKQDQKDRCTVHFKRPDGTAGPSHVFSGSLQALHGLSVYKFGASTGKTDGIIGSANYRYRDLISDFNILIEPEPEENKQRIFASEGDSGSTVCALEEDDNATINVIAMVSAGRMTVEDDLGLQTEIVMAFYLQKGLDTLTVKLHPCDY